MNAVPATVTAAPDKTTAPTSPLSNPLPISAVTAYFTDLQTRIVTALEAADGARFQRDVWQRPDDAATCGGGVSMLLEGGALFERAGVLYSHVHGEQLPPSASAQRSELAGRPWQAMGVSMVLHPKNPFVPTTHMNVRLFVTTAADGGSVFWFGGGMDLTPYYPFIEDARHFHRVCQSALAPFGPEHYPRYKRWCDDYFYLKHRNEQRGVGGVFFDDLNFADPARSSAPDFDRSFALTRSVGNAFLDAYLPIVARRRDTPFGARERDFQAYRRGRYVEFNLVFDRGTLFGLQSGGRTESILLSMPPGATWRYDWTPEAGSAEARLAEYLTPRDWV